MSAASPTVRVVAPHLGLGPACRALLDSLPGWFGIPESNDEYVAFVEGHPTWSALDEHGTVVGLLAPSRHAQSSEIYLIAVRPEWHRRGVGRMLVDAFEAAALSEGLRLAQVKTLGPSHPDEGYARTRRFYESLGYLQLEELHDLWPENPALVMVKPLVGPQGEAGVIARTAEPVTRTMVAAGLRAAGVRAGSVVMVHSSLSRLGWVLGGGQAVVEALFEVVGPDGTIAMPAQSSVLSEPSRWENPPVPEGWWSIIRDEMPAFDPHLTPVQGIGVVAECLLRHPSTVRSAHPAMSLMANGPLAEHIVAPHEIGDAVGNSSPLARLYDLRARVVLLGVGHGNNTSLHLAEARTHWARSHTISYGAPMMVDGRRQWVRHDDIDYDSDDFPALGEAFGATGGETRVPLGAGEIIACDMRAIVDFATGWLDANRPASPLQPG
ncbi:MAG: GNAT family N-acetyltransferase [Ilumatobacteraceae bacterium]